MRRRDPRIDPLPGDILRFGGVYGAKYHEVLEHDPKFAMNDVSSFCEGRESQRSLNQWREWAATAEVVRRRRAVNS